MRGDRVHDAGSVASTCYSAPRTTQDVDIVVEVDGRRLESLLALLPDERFYFDTDAAREALRRRSLFNVIDMESGWKADLIIRKGRTFSEEELTRRVRVELLGISVWMATPEDCVISKLEWARASSKRSGRRSADRKVDAREGLARGSSRGAVPICNFPCGGRAGSSFRQRFQPISAGGIIYDGHLIVPYIIKPGPQGHLTGARKKSFTLTRDCERNFPSAHPGYPHCRLPLLCTGAAPTRVYSLVS